MSHPTESVSYAYEPATGNLASITTLTGVGLTYTYDGSLQTSVSQTWPIAGSVSWQFDVAEGAPKSLYCGSNLAAPANLSGWDMTWT